MLVKYFWTSCALDYIKWKVIFGEVLSSSLIEEEHSLLEESLTPKESIISLLLMVAHPWSCCSPISGGLRLWVLLLCSKPLPASSSISGEVSYAKAVHHQQTRSTALSRNCPPYPVPIWSISLKLQKLHERAHETTRLTIMQVFQYSHCKWK